MIENRFKERGGVFIQWTALKGGAQSMQIVIELVMQPLVTVSHDNSFMLKERPKK